MVFKLFNKLKHAINTFSFRYFQDFNINLIINLNKSLLYKNDKINMFNIKLIIFIKDLEVE